MPASDGSARRVLVTGGGGWIGSEIARQVAAFGPADLVLLDHDETHLHDTAQALRGAARLALADIRDQLDAFMTSIGLRREYGRFAVKFTAVSIFASAIIG